MSSSLASLIVWNDLYHARLMLEAGADVNEKIGDELPPLHTAVGCGNLAAIRLLLEYKADVSLKAGKHERTGLHNCAAYGTTKGYYEICQLLLENGASCEERDREGCTPFLLSMKYKNLKAAQFLLDHGADSKAADNHGQTALHHAVEDGDADRIRFALQQGINIDNGNNLDYSALQLAAAHGRPEVCEFLIKHGANLAKKSTITGHTPLTQVLARSHAVNTRDKFALRMVQTLHLLLDHGAPIADKFRNRSILQAAAAKKSSECLIDVLMQYIAKMKYLNLKVDEHDLRTIESKECYRKRYQVYLQEMEAEVELLSETKFYHDLPISILLTSDEKVISGYARNDELVDALFDEVYDSKFSILFATLKRRFFVEVEKQSIRKAAFRILNDIFQLNDPFYPVIEKILSFFSDKDLKCLGI